MKGNWNSWLLVLMVRSIHNVALKIKLLCLRFHLCAHVQIHIQTHAQLLPSWACCLSFWGNKRRANTGQLLPELRWETGWPYEALYSPREINITSKTYKDLQPPSSMIVPESQPWSLRDLVSLEQQTQKKKSVCVSVCVYMNTTGFRKCWGKAAFEIVIVSINI